MRLKSSRTILAVLLLALISLAGCSSSSSPKASSGKIVLKVAYGSTFVFLTPALATEWWHDVAKTFEAQHPNVTIQWIPIPGSYTDIVDKLSLLYRSSSTAPDVAELPSPQLGAWETSGYLLPLNKYLSSSSWWATFPQAVKMEGTLNGTVYAVNHFEATDALLYNIPDFRKAGIAVPWHPKTWADILAACAKLKAAVPGVAPFLVIGEQPSGTEGILLGSGNLLAGASTPTIFDNSTKKWVVGSPGLTQVFSFFHSLAAGGYNPPISELFSPDAIDNAPGYMADQKVAIAVAPNFWGESWVKFTSAPYFPEAPKLFGFAPIPTSDAQGPDIASTLGGWDLAIGAHTANPQLAWDFINAAQTRVNMIDASNWGGGVPPDPAYFKDPLYANFAPPFQTDYGNIESYAQEAPTTADYAIWATGFNDATGDLTENRNMTVQQAVNVMKSYVTGQLGAGSVETLP